MRNTTLNILTATLLAVSPLAVSEPAALDDFNEAVSSGQLVGEGGAVDQYASLRDKVSAAEFVESGVLLATALEDFAADTYEMHVNGGQLLAPSANELEDAADALDQVIALRGVTDPKYPTVLNRSRFLRGWAMLLDNDNEAAAELLDKVEPVTPMSLVALGFARYQLDESEAAAESFAKAAESAPEWSEARRFQGFVAQYENDWPKALQYYGAAAELDPSNARLQVDIGEVHAESGDLIAAMDAWRSALDIDAEGMADVIATFVLERLVVADRDELAESVYTEAIMREPGSTQLLVDRADFYRLAERYPASEADFREALKIDRDSVAVHNGLGLLYEQQEMYAKAKRSYRRAAALAPDRAYPFRNLGDVYSAEEQYDDAIAAYQQAIEIESDATGAMQGLGRVYVELEQFELAEEQFLQYASVADDAGAYNDLGIFYEVHVSRYGDALAAYEKARELGETAEIIANIGDANRRLGRYHLAVSAYNDALRLDPAQEYALEGLDRLEDHAVVAAKDRSVEVIRGRLEPDGETLDDGSLYAAHTLVGKAGDQWTLLLRSDAFDPFLMVYETSEEKAVELARDDDSGSDTDASLVVTLPHDGHFSVLANSYDSGSFGDYEIVLMRARDEKPKLGEEQVFRAELTDGGDTMDDESFYNMHIVPAQAGEALDITLASAAFDAYLFLLDPDGDVLFEDDDSAQGTNARGSFIVPITGNYTAIVNTVEPESVGPYSLVVRRGTPDEIMASEVGIEKFTGELTSDSEMMADDSRFESHVVSGAAGETLNLTLTSPVFDVYLFVFDSDGNVLAEDDDSAGGTDAKLTVTLPADGDYLVVANSVGNDALGPYTIDLRRN